MHLIIGLGNPGKKYEHTRHNIGFQVVDALARELGIQFHRDKKFNAEVAEVPLDSHPPTLAKPLTFMNNSGEAVKKLLAGFRYSVSDLLIIQDEVDLRFGQIRVSTNSSSAGHNGINSIIAALKTEDFTRLRIGIDARARRDERDTHDYVLDTFTPEEETKLKQQVIPAALEEIKRLLLPR